MQGWPTGYAYYISYVTSKAGYNANLPADWKGQVLVHKFKGAPATCECCAAAGAAARARAPRSS